MIQLIDWDKKKLARELKADKRRNFLDNLKFVNLHVAWLKRKSNKEWSRRQKLIIDEVYKTNRHLKLSAPD